MHPRLHHKDEEMAEQLVTETGVPRQPQEVIRGQQSHLQEYAQRTQ